MGCVQWAHTSWEIQYWMVAPQVSCMDSFKTLDNQAFDYIQWLFRRTIMSLVEKKDVFKTSPHLSARLKDKNQHDEIQLIFSQCCWIVKTASAPFRPCEQNTFSHPIPALSAPVRVNYNYNSIYCLQDRHYLPFVVFTLSLLCIKKRVAGM